MSDKSIFFVNRVGRLDYLESYFQCFIDCWQTLIRLLKTIPKRKYFMASFYIISHHNRTLSFTENLAQHFLISASSFRFNKRIWIWVFQNISNQKLVIIYPYFLAVSFFNVFYLQTLLWWDRHSKLLSLSVTGIYSPALHLITRWTLLGHFR